MRSKNPLSKHFFALLQLKIAMGLGSQSRNQRLSYLWWILEPSFEACVLYVVFGIFMVPGINDFVAFLLIGLIPWTWFSRSVSNAMMSIRMGAWLLHSMKLNPVFFPLVEIGQDAVKQLVTFSLLLIFLTLYGIVPTGWWALVPIIMLLQLCLVITAGCLVAILIPFLEDLKYLIGTALLATMFASGIFYDPSELVTESWRTFFYANPVASLIGAYRAVLLYGEAPAILHITVVLIWILLLGVTGSTLLALNRNKYARLVAE